MDIFYIWKLLPQYGKDVYEMKKSTQLRKILNKKKATPAIGCHDLISAKLIEKAGFEIIQVSGFGLAATLLGLPDMAFLTYTEMLHITTDRKSVV